MRLFTKTCRKDYKYLRIALISVVRFCREAMEWTIVCDQGESEELKKIIADQFGGKTNSVSFKFAEIQDHWPDAAELGDGYVQQQWVKMTAHRIMGMEYFLNWDSDVAATKDFWESDFCGKSRRPILWFTPFNDITIGEHVEVHQMRRHFMMNVFELREISFEWMRCMPIWMNGEILRVGETRSEWNRTRILLRAKQYAGMSEFNIIGQFSNMFFPDAYEWRNTQNSGPTWAGPLNSEDAIVYQGWSWGDIPEDLKRWVDSL